MPPFQSEQPCPEPRQLPSARAHQRPRVPQQVDRRQLPGTGSAHTHATRLPSSVHTRPCGICCPRRPREQQPEPPLAVTRYQPRPDRIVPIRTRQHPGEPLRVSRPGPHESHHAGKVRAGNRACQGYPRPRPAWRRDQGAAGGPGPATRWSDWGRSRETGGPAGERASPGAASWRWGQQWPGSSCAGRAYGRRHRGALTGLPCVRTGGVADWRVPGRAGTWLTDPAAGRRAPS